MHLEWVPTTSLYVQLMADKPETDLSIDIAPLICVTQSSDHVLESVAVLKGVLEPDQEFERLAKIAIVVQTPSNHRQISHADCDVTGVLFENLSALVLRQDPLGFRFPDRD